jgi:flagellin
VTINAGATTYSFVTTPTMTVRDLVNSINGSGIATASVDSTGKLTVTGAGSSPLKLDVQKAAAGDGLDNLGFSAADVTLLTGTGAVVAANSTVRANLVAQFNDLRDQIDKLASDAGYNGVNLLAGDRLQIVFNEKSGAMRSTMQVQGNKLTSASVGVLPAANAAGVGQINFQNDIDLTTASESLTTAMMSLRSLSSNLGSQLGVVQSRQDFTKNIVNTLKTGADNLVLADTNEEGANLLALQTRQQLSQTALSLAAQADQSVLKLFG